MLSEELLIARAKARDPQAWGHLYDAHYLSIYRYAYARLRRREEAEDVASQVFLEALTAIDKFRYRGKPLLAWLYRIARNLIVDHTRRQERHGRLLPLITPIHENVASLDQRLENLELLDAVSRLTPDQREVVILRFLVSLPAREVALILGKKETAIFSLQNRAIKALKRSLEPEDPSVAIGWTA